MDAVYWITNRTKLGISEYLKLAASKRSIQFSDELWRKIREARRVVEDNLDHGVAVYGLNTGLGALVDQPMPDADTDAAQRRIITTRACGTGAPLSSQVSRAAMLARILSISKGVSGLHPNTVDMLIGLYNAGIMPVVPATASIGASDLLSNAHLMLPLIGQGEVWTPRGPVPSERELEKAGVRQCALHAKDGVALINHSAVSIAMASMAIESAKACLHEGMLAALVSFEGFAGNRSIFDDRVNTLRPAGYQREAAEWFREALADSKLSARRVQDPLSFRLSAVVFGAARQSLKGGETAIEAELNGTSDSPAVLIDAGEMVSTPNFFNPGITNALKCSSIALFDCARASVQRCQKLMMPELSGLPRCLSPVGGVSSGMIPLLKTANALLLEISALAQASLVALPPVSEAVEDMDSDGLQIAIRMEKLTQTMRRLSGLEALVAAQAVDLRGPGKASSIVRALHARIRQDSPMLTKDRSLAWDLETVQTALKEFAEVRSM